MVTLQYRTVSRALIHGFAIHSSLLKTLAPVYTFVITYTKYNIHQLQTCISVRKIHIITKEHVKRGTSIKLSVCGHERHPTISSV